MVGEILGRFSEERYSSESSDILLITRSSLKCFFNSHNPQTGCVCEIIPHFHVWSHVKVMTETHVEKMLSTVIPVNASYICALIRMAGCQRTFSGSINILAYYLKLEDFSAERIRAVHLVYMIHFYGFIHYRHDTSVLFEASLLQLHFLVWYF